MGTVWIDIDNPPQVQYLVPVACELERRGYSVVTTARDNSITHELLDDRGAKYLPVGRAFGRQKWRKVVGVFGRAINLVRAVRHAHPEVLLCASRSGALAARFLGIPGIAVCDYEHAELTSYAKLGTFIAFPDAIAASSFEAKGFSPDRLFPFPGLKEHLTFYGCDLSSIDAFHPPGAEPSSVVVVFRPPAAETHYYSPESNVIYDALLDQLSNRHDIHLVFVPRYPWQVEQLRRWEWDSPVYVPEHPIPPVSLLKGADLVISSGGTMLREAAYLGVPAYSIFQSALGEVDMDLERRSMLALLTGPEDFGRIRFEKRSSDPHIVDSADTMEKLLEIVVQQPGMMKSENQR